MSARFKGDEGRLNFQGRALSGLISNIIMLLAVWVIPKSESSSSIFVIYLIIGDLGMVVFYILMTSFFKHCMSDIYNKTTSEHFFDGDYELKEKHESKSKALLVAQASVNDITKNCDDETLSYSEILKKAPDTFIGMVFVFTITLCCFPVLIFRMDIGITTVTKFVLLTLVFNIGDTVSRYFYTRYTLTSTITIHIINASRIFFPFLFLICINAETGIVSLTLVKILIVFAFSFSNGYLCMCYFELSAARFDSPYDRNRSGNLIAIGLEIGLMCGAIVGCIW